MHVVLRFKPLELYPDGSPHSDAAGGPDRPHHTCGSRFPNIAVMAIQAGIGLVETYFIAKLGTGALAGLALVFPGSDAVRDDHGRRDGWWHPVSGLARARFGAHRRRQRTRMAIGLDRARARPGHHHRDAVRRWRAVFRDGRNGRGACRSADLFACGVRRRDSALAVQLARRRHPWHRQYAGAGPGDGDWRCHSDSAFAVVDLRLRSGAGLWYRRRRGGGGCLLCRRQRDLRSLYLVGPRRIAARSDGRNASAGRCRATF